jgi:NAD(P)H-dependent flavin oxidoreductase YrpB (nitropropane dioxygenase family)
MRETIKIEDLRRKSIIQGGMGAGVSGHRIVRKVSRYGQLGVISATAPDNLLIRGLQNGDLGGELREALQHFPNRDIADGIVNRFFIEGGRSAEEKYILNPFPSFEKTGDSEFILKNIDLEDSLVAGAFVEVYLAKRGHENPVGANFLNKIGWAQLQTLYGAMLAGLDVALIGAGFPKNIPEVLDAFTCGDVGKIIIPISGKSYNLTFDPKRFNSPELSRPIFLGIVGNHLGLRGLPNADGYVFEGSSAGGHNPPARSKALNDIGEPLYGPKDEMDFNIALDQLNGRPFWLAGNYATRLKEALSHGACGVQVGTPFAFCADSEITRELKERALVAILSGAKAYTNARSSPTGFPFKELQVPETLSVPELYSERQRICNIGFLLELYEQDGRIKTRCPAEPENDYVRKGGNIEGALGRKCLCNALCATIGLGACGEKPLITSGSNFDAVKDLVLKYGMQYSAENVIDYILNKDR